MLNSLIFLTIGEIALIAFLVYSLTRIKIKVLKKYQSKFAGPVEIRRERDGELRMVMNYCTQGISTEKATISQSYWGKIAQMTIHTLPKPENAHILHIGLGANTISNLIGRNHPSPFQTIVEIDPVIIKACREYFKLDELENSEVIQQDIFELLSQKPEWHNHFDVIITDIYTGKESEYTPKQGKYDFISQLAAWLNDAGTIIFNRPAHTDTAKQDTAELEKYLRDHFRTVEKIYVEDPRGFKNYILTASRTPHTTH